MFKCEKCEFKDKTLSGLTQHKVAAHTERQPLACDQCEFTCTKKVRLDDYIKLSHQADKVESDESIVYCCTKCRFESDVESKLDEHMNNKHDKVVCEECDVRMESKTQLKEHTSKKHPTIACQIFNFNAKSKVELNQHVSALHNKMFQCKECRFKGTSTKILDEHERKGGQIFTCEECDYFTIIKNNLIEHIKIRHKQKDAQHMNFRTENRNISKGSLQN